MAKQSDLVVIGAGAGGYIAAIRAAPPGMSVACIDAWSTSDGKPAPGGTCPGVGCMPSGALVRWSECAGPPNHPFADHGIEVKGVSRKPATLVGRADTVVTPTDDGILYLFKKNKVTLLHGTGAFSRQVGGGWS